MSKGIVSRITGTLSLLILSLIEGYSQDAKVQSVRIMFYNVENLFDIYDDTITDDDEFLPGSIRRWNYSRYTRKVNSLYKTILAAGEWSPPEVVALCEIENRKVLEDLVYGTNLSKYNYSIVHQDSPDPRGIDVCLIYRNDIVDVFDYRYMQFRDSRGNQIATRSVLYSKCLVLGDTIHLFVNHWPSRRGGVLAGESFRTRIAGMIRDMADSIASFDDPDARIIVMGDFNATPDDQEINMIAGKSGSGLSLINLSESLSGEPGTYRYRGTWEMMDQVIVSDRLLNCSSGICLRPGLLRIFKPDFLLRKDPVYPGMTPFSTWLGYRYQGGYSDHLPVLFDLIVR
jgi:predicted extracellular nuclease